LLFSQPSLSTDLAANLAELVSFSDEQLWAIVHRRLPWSESLRLRELIAQSKQTALVDSEQRELEHLLELVDRSMLLRSEALLRLKERGRDVERYLTRET
jgi:succinate dehydrogenase flavin-adding protein (antitoxin of CptAB toxin-antitoxin module)